MRRSPFALVLATCLSACDGGSIATRGTASQSERLDSLERRIDRLERAEIPESSARQTAADSTRRPSP